MAKTSTKRGAKAANSSRSGSQSKSGGRSNPKGSSGRSSGKTTTSHEAIRKWAEARDGHPATVKQTGRGKSPGILRIDFPGYRGKESLQEISWDQFFDKFEEQELAFLYQDKTASGRPSRFCKLVNRRQPKGKSAGRKPR